jgi:hypothetical protein
MNIRIKEVTIELHGWRHPSAASSTDGHCSITAGFITMYYCPNGGRCGRDGCS